MQIESEKLEAMRKDVADHIAELPNDPEWDGIEVWVVGSPVVLPAEEFDLQIAFRVPFYRIDKNAKSELS
jgi:hypothetical protein